MIDLIKNLTPEELRLHRLAQARCKARNRIDWEIVEVLQKIDARGFFKKLGRNSLHCYANMELDLTRGLANCFVSVARAGMAFPILQKAMRELKITVSIAVRMIAAMTPENAEQLVEFATTHSKNETEREMDRIRGNSGKERMVKVEMPLSVFKKHQRANSVRAQEGHTEKIFETAGVMADEFLDHHDPLKKAERAAKRAAKRNAARTAEQSSDLSPDRDAEEACNPAKGAEKRPCPGREQGEVATTRAGTWTGHKRKPKTAEQIHAVNLRDQCQCTFVDAEGNRCEEDRYLHHHHIVEVHKGGTNDSTNLTTLCSFHHDLVHQLSLPIEGQISWPGGSRRAYYGWHIEPH